jgi:hypothetical protein
MWDNAKSSDFKLPGRGGDAAAQINKAAKEFTKGSSKINSAAKAIAQVEDVRTEAGAAAVGQSYQESYGKPKEITLLEKIAAATQFAARKPPVKAVPV